MTSPSFSQTVTDTSFVVLPEVIAREIARDLIQKDRLERENTLLYSQIKIKDELILNNTEIISRLESRILLLEEISVNREKQIQEYKNLTRSLQSDLRRTRIQKNIYRASSGLMIIGAGAFYLTQIYVQ